jgi:hypothetical protein
MDLYVNNLKCIGLHVLFIKRVHPVSVGMHRVDVGCITDVSETINISNFMPEAALQMDEIRISEISAIQLTFTRCHHSEIGPQLLV